MLQASVVFKNPRGPCAEENHGAKAGILWGARLGFRSIFKRHAQAKILPRDSFVPFLLKKRKRNILIEKNISPFKGESSGRDGGVRCSRR
jgi:hypothetical protein